MGKKYNWLPFEEARIFSQALKIKNCKEWNKYCKSGNKPNNIPANPNTVYKNKWLGWNNWLGAKIAPHLIEFIPFDKARELARSLNLKSFKEWEQYSKSGIKPDNIPAAPWQTYSSEWVDIYDWLGKKKSKPLSSTHPELAKEWYQPKNGDITPNDITAYSGKKYYWRGTKCGHIWDARVSDRTVHNSNCPYCRNLRVCNDNSLATLFPEIAKEWHPNKNGDLIPNDIVAGSSKKIWWECKKCKHEWKVPVDERTRQDGKATNCPKCGIRSRTEKQTGEGNHNWNPDRKYVELREIISKKCGKLIRHTLDATDQIKFRKTEEYLGYTRLDLLSYLNDNYKNWSLIKDLHIDHIFPIKAFVEHNIIEPSIINALDNLRPLPKKENLQKGDKYNQTEFYNYLKNKYGEEFVKKYNILPDIISRLEAV